VDAPVVRYTRVGRQPDVAVDRLARVGGGSRSRGGCPRGE
jgi:hypothetical protein